MTYLFKSIRRSPFRRGGARPKDERDMTTPQELKNIVSDGLLSFPVTDFDRNGDFNAPAYARRLEWLAP